MKILHVVGSLDRGGVETWLTQILHHIDRQKYQMDFLVHTDRPGAYDREIESLGARVFVCLPRLDDRQPLTYARNFCRILRHYGPYDCVHSHIHHSSGFILLLATAFDIPMRIVHSHNDTRRSEAKASLPRKLFRAAMRLLIRQFATSGIAVSEAAACCLFPRGRSSRDRWEICPLGIDLEPFRQEVETSSLRAELGISSSAFVVGHVGRFDAQKNQIFLVAIAEKLCLLQPNTIFLLVGEGPERSSLESAVHRLGLSRHFIFAGSRADVPRWMKGAMDCFVFPSLYEGLGLVLWEAQAAGLQCIIADSLPREATVLPHRVQRLSLQSGPEVWARELLRCQHDCDRQSPEEFPAAIAAISIKASALRLTQIYDQCFQRRSNKNSFQMLKHAQTARPPALHRTGDP